MKEENARRLSGKMKLILAVIVIVFVQLILKGVYKDIGNPMIIAVMEIIFIVVALKLLSQPMALAFGKTCWAKVVKKSGKINHQELATSTYTKFVLEYEGKKYKFWSPNGISARSDVSYAGNYAALYKFGIFKACDLLRVVTEEEIAIK